MRDMYSITFIEMNIIATCVFIWDTFIDLICINIYVFVMLCYIVGLIRDYTIKRDSKQSVAIPHTVRLWASPGINVTRFGFIFIKYNSYHVSWIHSTPIDNCTTRILLINDVAWNIWLWRNKNLEEFNLK